MNNDLSKIFSDRLNRPVKIKINDFHQNRALKHLIFSNQFELGLLEHLCGLADQIKDLRKDKNGSRFLKELLDNKGAELYFTQSSTRTFKSFEKACQILGMEISETRDVSLSSEYKGESFLDSVRMYSSYADIIIMRSKEPKLAECSAYSMNDIHSDVPIINAGSGADEHPTQALLDIYTIYRSFKSVDPSKVLPSNYDAYQKIKKNNPELAKKGSGPENKIYGFCGDVGRGRTVRSLISLLANNYKNLTFYFFAPNKEKLRLPNDLRLILDRKGITYYEYDKLSKKHIKCLDILYMTRIQNEHNDEVLNEYLTEDVKKNFYLTEELVEAMKQHAKVMHPFPRNNEIGTAVDTNKRAIYFKQARNGIWIRAALIAYLLNQDREINKYHSEFSELKHDYNESVL